MRTVHVNPIRGPRFRRTSRLMSRRPLVAPTNHIIQPGNTKVRLDSLGVTELICPGYLLQCCEPTKVSILSAS